MWLVDVSFWLVAFIAFSLVLFAVFQLGTVFWMTERLLEALQKLHCNLEARRQIRAEKVAAEVDPIRQR